jgi:hypothetical protein
MTLLQAYVLAHIFLRSFSNGVDRICNTNLEVVPIGWTGIEVC